MIFNISLSIIALLILFYLLKKQLSTVILSYVILLQYIWMFCSLIVIENGIFINEQGRDGYFVYAGAILFIFYLSTIISLILFNQLFSTLFRKENSIQFKFVLFKEESLIKISMIFLMLVAYINLLSSPIPLFDDSVTKFNFWENAKYPFLSNILGNVMGFVAFGSSLLFRYSKKTSLFLMVFYFFYLLLIGQKFSGFLIGSYAIFVAYYFTSKKNITFRLGWIFNKYTAIISTLFFLLVLYYYNKKNPFEYLGLSPLESVFYRTFGLQAHVFWGTVERYVFLNQNNSWDPKELWRGMHHLMFEFWPWSIQDYHSVTSRGVSWTNAYPAILVRIFPWPLAVLVNFILISFVALVQSLLKFFIEKKSYLLSIISFQLLTWVSFSYTMGYFNKLVAPIIFIIILVLFKILINEYKNFKVRE